MSAQGLIVDLVIRYGFQVLGAVVIIGVGALVAKWVGGVTDRRLQRQAMDPPLRTLIVRALRIVVLLFALVVALDKFGFQVAPLVAGIGVAGLGLGIALQGVLSNMVAGLTIILTKPFRLGEYVELLGVHGEVSAIELSSTTLTHPDRSRVIVPNRKIVGEILHNYGSTRQLHLAFTVRHEADLALVLEAARQTVSGHPRVLKDPAPVAGVTQVGDSGIKIGIQPWVRGSDAATAEPELYEALVERFRALGIGAPPVQHEVRLLDGDRPAAPSR